MGTDNKIGERIVFFDGVCNLCNSSVNFLIDRDPNSKFQFAPLQSDFASETLKDFHFSPEDLESIVFYTGTNAYRKSRAILEITKRMRGLWPLFYVMIIIPGFLRDPIYNWIARNRYKWFGQQDACRIPTPELKARFLG